jgi:hypothetical protein
VVERQSVASRTADIAPSCAEVALGFPAKHPLRLLRAQNQHDEGLELLRNCPVGTETSSIDTRIMMSRTEINIILCNRSCHQTESAIKAPIPVLLWL